MSWKVLTLPPQPLSPRCTTHRVDGGESVVSATSLRAILESSEPASDVKPTRGPTLTTWWPEDGLRQFLCQGRFRDADGWSANPAN
jgi:hypothetical protein